MPKIIRNIFFLSIALCFIFAGCAEKEVISSKSSGNAEYEKQTIVIEEGNEEVGEISVAEMRQLPQQEMEGSFQRTTGLMENFLAAGPTLSDVFNYVDINLKDYKGIGFMGADGYYCLVTPEIIENRELLIALAIDGQVELAEDLRPARLCVEGEFGPYWVRMLNKIILYKEIPRKEINSVWIFSNLAEGIEPYPYEYYGSKDDAIELAQIFSRFDNVNNEAFFTMKSADGFKKNEAINMVSKGYYIKVAGNDAPMNIAPNIKLGMNVKNIAWFSSNADAAVFPEKMMELIGSREINGIKGLSLGEMLEEVELRGIEEKSFELQGVNGETVRVSAQDLYRGLVVNKEDGSCPVIWEEGIEVEGIADLLRIRAVPQD